MSTTDRQAVFLSYASQDAEAAKRICEALRAVGVEVWLDLEGGLVGGDAWDRKIRDQINACALFVPIISANTQARKEGYFRLEWHLAEERVRLIAKGVPFIVPVSIDGTLERGALVPDAFLAVQWTRLPGGEAPAAFVARVSKLLGASTPEPNVAATQTAPPLSSAVAIQNSELSTAVRPAPEAAFETYERQRSLWRRALPVVSAVVLTALVAGLLAWRLWPKAAPGPVSRFAYRLPEGQMFRTTGHPLLAVSPDGRRWVYNTNSGLQLRSLDEIEARLIPGTEIAVFNPFFSPDGRWIGYQQNAELKRIAVEGGTPVIIGSFRPSSYSPDAWIRPGASWAPDGTILLSHDTGIVRVPASGGTPQVVIAAPSDAHLTSPQLLPDGDTVLFTERSAGDLESDRTRIVAQKISTGARKVLVEGGVEGSYVSTGHLVYVVGNVLMGVAFDVRQLAVTGGAVPVAQGVMRSHAIGRMYAANYAIAGNGTLVLAYSTAVVGTDLWQIGLGDRSGRLRLLALPPGPYGSLRASPDGTRIAVTMEDAREAYVAIYDLGGKTLLRRLTFGGKSRYPVWSRDGQRVAFQSDREGDQAIFWERADGTGTVERLTKPEKDTAHVPASWSPQDETLLFTVTRAGESSGAIWTYTRASGTAAPFGNVERATLAPMFSPDGRWVAYAQRGGSRSRGIFIQPFPATGNQYEVPRQEGENPGVHPVWSPDGQALLYGPGPGLMARVNVTTQPTVEFGKPTAVPRPFNSSSVWLPRTFDVLPDGQFVGRIAPEQVGDGGGQPEMRIVLNWTEELKRLVPVK